MYVHGNTAVFTMNNGTISGNDAVLRGGGVLVDAVNSAKFTKTGNSTIYGTDGGAYANTADLGAAVYVNGNPVKVRNLTAGPGVDLDSAMGEGFN